MIGSNFAADKDGKIVAKKVINNEKREIIIISIFSLLITFLATIFPSLSAARLDPVKALKYE